MPGIRPSVVPSTRSHSDIWVAVSETGLCRIPVRLDDASTHDALPDRFRVPRFSIPALWGLGAVQLRASHRLWPAGAPTPVGHRDHRRPIRDGARREDAMSAPLETHLWIVGIAIDFVM